MATTTDLSTLKINYLTQAQYNTALANNTINANELYFTPFAPVSASSEITGVLPIANGGTGNSSFTALRAIFAESATKLSSSGHYMSSSKLAINSTSEPSYNFYVNGTSYFNGNTTHNGVVYFANGTSYYVNNSGSARLNTAEILSSTAITHNIASTPWGNITWSSRAGTSGIGSGTTTYTTITQGTWANLYYQIPAKRLTYETAGDTSSTVTATYYYPAKFFFRQYSPTSTGTRTSYYEDYTLPNTNVDRTSSASYEIFTSKSYTTLDARYVNVSGDTMTGQLQKASTGQSWVNGRSGALIRNTAATYTANNYNPLISIKSINGTWDIGTYTTNNSLYFTYITDTNFNAGTNATTAQMEFRGSDNSIRASKVYGAVWNDYAEYRIATTQIPGKCVVEVGNDTLELSTKRLQPGCEIISDTYGFAIGETEKAKTPIATTGRVLAYPYENIEEFKKHIGEPVCSGPNGTVSIMTEEEWQKYPHCIIGTISAVPDYEEWGTENIKINGRIWIRIR